MSDEQTADGLAESLEGMAAVLGSGHADDGFKQAASLVAEYARTVLEKAKSQAESHAAHARRVERDVRTMKADALIEDAMTGATSLLVDAMKTEALLREVEADVLNESANVLQVEAALKELEAALAESKGGDES